MIPKVPWTSTERRFRDELLHAILPAPGRGLPALSALDLSAFWARFDEVAPLHLQLGLRAAALLCGGLLPRILTGRSLAALSETERSRALARLTAAPGGATLIEVAKVVAGLAYFSDPHVEDLARSRS